MQIEELAKFGIPDWAVEKLGEKKIEKLNPAQEAAVKSGLLKGKNLVLASPTASGKTLVAMLAIAKKVSEGKKALYVVPLRALASEKYEEFAEFFSGYKVAISTGDYDASDEKLGWNDIIVLTVEKLDSLMRHNISWLESAGIAVADEVHLINDASRGPTLEIVLTRLKKTGAQILALSATIKNVSEIAGWLEAEKAASAYRPVKLWQGVFDGRKIKYLNREEKKIGEAADEKELALAEDTLKMKKQCIIFAGTRKSAENSAEKAAERAMKFLDSGEKAQLKEKSDRILSALGSPTQQCKKLSVLVSKGAAFHHAGLAGSQRKIIEEAFRDGLIKIIASTPTLAAGVNLPAYRCILRDMKRFYAGLGSRYIPVLEYQQMAGRAGRPRFDSEGEAIIVAKSSNEGEELFEKYVMGEAEEITSKLAVEPILKTHVLALISSGLRTNEEIADFFSKTFYAFQYGNISALFGKLRNVISELIGYGFAETCGDEIRATRMGRRVSELYLNPDSGWKFSRALALQSKEFGLLQLIASANEMMPALYVRNSEYPDMEEQLTKREAELMIADGKDIFEDDALGSFKTALFLESWCSEKGEDFIFEKFGVSPGELHARLEIADWLLYCCHEIAFLLGMKESLNTIKKLRTRLKYGVMEELLPLVRLRGIGRVRARKLWNSSVRSVFDLRKVPLEKLAALIGAKTAEEIKRQVTDGKEDGGQTELNEY